MVLPLLDDGNLLAQRRRAGTVLVILARVQHNAKPVAEHFTPRSGEVQRTFDATLSAFSFPLS